MASIPVNPYHVPAGGELDALIHQQVLGNQIEGRCPSYSTDKVEAERLKTALKRLLGREIVTGQTRIRGRGWFARYESDPSTSTEVLADTYPLAICRLALLRNRT